MEPESIQNTINATTESAMRFRFIKLEEKRIATKTTKFLYHCFGRMEMISSFIILTTSLTFLNIHIPVLSTILYGFRENAYEVLCTRYITFLLSINFHAARNVGLHFEFIYKSINPKLIKSV